MEQGYNGTCQLEDNFHTLMIMRMRMINDDAMEFHFGLRLHDRAVDYASFHKYPGVNQARELQTPAVLVK